MTIDLDTTLAGDRDRSPSWPGRDEQVAKSQSLILREILSTVGPPSFGALAAFAIMSYAAPAILQNPWQVVDDPAGRRFWLNSTTGETRALAPVLGPPPGPPPTGLVDADAVAAAERYAAPDDGEDGLAAAVVTARISDEQPPPRAVSPPLRVTLAPDEHEQEVERKVVDLFLDPAYDEPMMIAGFRTRGRRCTRPLNWWFEEGWSIERDITLGYQRGGPPTKFFVLVRKKPLPRARQVD